MEVCQTLRSNDSFRWQLNFESNIDSEAFCDFLDGTLVKQAQVEVNAVRVDGVAAGLSNELSHTTKVVFLTRVRNTFLK